MDASPHRPTLQSVHLTAVLPSQIEAEAKAKECDFLYSAISQKGQPDAAKHARLLKSASPMSSMIPMMGMGRGVAGMVASTVATSALNGAVEAKDEGLRAQLGESYQNLSNSYFSVGDWGLTEKFRTMALTTFEQLHKSDPGNGDYQRAFALACLRMAGLK